MSFANIHHNFKTPQLYQRIDYAIRCLLPLLKIGVFASFSMVLLATLSLTLGISFPSLYLAAELAVTAGMIAFVSISTLIASRFLIPWLSYLCHSNLGGECCSRNSSMSAFFKTLTEAALGWACMLALILTMAIAASIIVNPSNLIGYGILGLYANIAAPFIILPFYALGILLYFTSTSLLGIHWDDFFSDVMDCSKGVHTKFSHHKHAHTASNIMHPSRHTKAQDNQPVPAPLHLHNFMDSLACVCGAMVNGAQEALRL